MCNVGGLRYPGRMTTTHTVATAAQQLIRDASQQLLHGLAADIPAAVAAVPSDPLTRIVAERALDRAGFTVLWHDLALPDAQTAHDGMQAVASQPIDLTLHYGKNHAALMGILRACIEAPADRIRAVGVQLPPASDFLYAAAWDGAVGLGVDRIMADVCSDVHFAAHKEDVVTPAAVQAHLSGVRGFELAAQYYVLEGAGCDTVEPMMRGYLGAVLRTFFPEGRLV